MKKSAKLLIALILLVAFLGVKSYVSKIESQSEEEIDEIITILEEDASNIKSISFSSSGEHFSFEKSNNVWNYSEDDQFPLNQDILSEVLHTITGMTADRVLEDVEDLSEYGLEDVKYSINLLGEENYIINIGMLNSATETYYINKDDVPENVYVVSADTIDFITKDLYDFALIEEFPYSDTTGSRRIYVEKDSSYELVKDMDLELWYVSDGVTSEKINTSDYNELASVIASLTFDSMVDYCYDDASKYGFDEPYTSITIDYVEEIKMENEDSSDEVEANMEESEEVEYVDKQFNMLIGDLSEDGSRYVTVNDSNVVYTISEESLMEITDKEVSDFWSMSVHYLSVNRLYSLVVNNENDTYKINVSRETSVNDEGEEETILTYELNGKILEDSTLFITFYNKINNLMAQQRIDEFKQETDAVFSVEFSDIDGNNTELSFYEYDINFYIAVIDEKFYLINKMDYRDLIDAFDLFVNDMN